MHSEKWYVDKYLDKILQGDRTSKTLMFLDLSEEVITLCKEKKATDAKSQVALIKQVNQKWNRIGELMKTKTGNSSDILLKDGFLKYYETKTPKIKEVE